MASEPTTSNSATAHVNSLIKGIEGIIVPIAENAIIAACPELGAPVIKQITEKIEQALADEATKIAEVYADFAVVDVQVDSEERNLSKELQAVIAAERSGDQNAIQTAIQAYQSAASALDHDDGSTQPQ